MAVCRFWGVMTTSGVLSRIVSETFHQWRSVLDFTGTADTHDVTSQAWGPCWSPT